MKCISGVSFKVDDPASVSAWQAEHPGVDATKRGFTHVLRRSYTHPDLVERTVSSTLPRSSEHFDKLGQQVMVNDIVDDLDALLVKLSEAGVHRVGNLQEYDHGRFAWVLDVEANKVELWEPPRWRAAQPIRPLSARPPYQRGVSNSS
ncbi:MAG: hypothetical protein QF921_01230 [Pseudomonadales bacterium]|nr:hypothetical protein [Pseudomonadales bacterium]MDP6472150.1 hypothetical protein [Pseudomonadales bacterium]MDP6826598.1 hypothetical protein [Pseudomonadales bacterium]MDP6970131.1 hypothetical protein [Pseudomonadales bacterium]